MAYIVVSSILDQLKIRVRRSDQTWCFVAEPPLICFMPEKLIELAAVVPVCRIRVDDPCPLMILLPLLVP